MDNTLLSISSLLRITYHHKRAGPSGHAVWGESLIAWMLRLWVRILLKTCMFVLACMCCVVLSCVGKGFVTGWSLVQRSPAECLNRLRNLPFNSTRALTRTVESLMHECRATDKWMNHHKTWENIVCNVAAFKWLTTRQGQNLVKRVKRQWFP
jgi:hypothetical protein